MSKRVVRKVDFFVVSNNETERGTFGGGDSFYKPFLTIFTALSDMMKRSKGSYSRMPGYICLLVAVSFHKKANKGGHN